ncbi:MAG: type II toxin-antitoxin system YafQ family toxin [Alphaproteobacteria bacterium]|jgi:mRNA interferase YafQ
MLKPIRKKSFYKDFKKCQKRGKDISKLEKVIELLEANQILPLKYRDHKLIGNFDGYRECHIEPDWLLIYKITDTELILYQTGSHADLFE